MNKIERLVRELIANGKLSVSEALALIEALRWADADKEFRAIHGEVAGDVVKNLLENFED